MIEIKDGLNLDQILIKHSDQCDGAEMIFTDKKEHF